MQSAFSVMFENVDQMSNVQTKLFIVLRSSCYFFIFLFSFIVVNLSSSLLCFSFRLSSVIGYVRCSYVLCLRNVHSTQIRHHKKNQQTYSYGVVFTQIKFKENRKVCLQCLHSIKLLKRSNKDGHIKKSGDCCKDLFDNVGII